MATLNGMLDAAALHANNGSDLAVAASQVVAKRMALGVAAAFDPLAADHVEFGRMIPEKMEAFATAGMVMLEQSNQAGWEISRLASDEVMTTARATMEMAGCLNPFAVAEVQGAFARAWFDRATSNFFTLGMMTLGVHQAAMVPIRRTVAANARRLAPPPDREE